MVRPMSVMLAVINRCTEWVLPMASLVHIGYIQSQGFALRRMAGDKMSQMSEARTGGVAVQGHIHSGVRIVVKAFD